MKDSNLIFKILEHCPAFKGLVATKIETILSNCEFEIRSFQKGDLIISMGDPCDELMIVTMGSVKGEMVDFSGKTIKIEDISAPRPLAVAFLFGKKAAFPVNVTANEDTDILVLPKSDVVKLMQTNVRFLNNYLNLICTKAQFLSQKLEFLSFKTIREKLAHYLLSNSSKNSNNVTLPKSQEEMAVFFGVTRPSFARVLKEFQTEGLIHFKRREISLVDRKGLISILKEYRSD